MAARVTRPPSTLKTRVDRPWRRGRSASFTSTRPATSWDEVTGARRSRAEGVWSIPQNNGNSFTPGTAGSGAVYNSASLVGFVNQEWPNADGSSYTAIPHPNAAATAYAPAVMKNAYGGYTTGMGITNTGSGTTTVTVTYHDQAGNPAGSRTRSLPANAYWGLYQGEAGTPLPTSFAGTAVLTSSLQPLAVIVNETNPNGQFLTYEGSGSSSTTLSPPRMSSMTPTVAIRPAWEFRTLARAQPR